MKERAEPELSWEIVRSQDLSKIINERAHNQVETVEIGDLTNDGVGLSVSLGGLGVG